MFKKKYVGIIGLVLVAVLALVSFLLGQYVMQRSIAKSEKRTEEASEKYDMLAKRLFLDNPNETKINFTPLRQQLNEYFEQNKLNGGNLYFEYLPTGTSVRISSDERLVAASLMKVPAVMDMYKAHELGRLDIDENVKIQSNWLNNEYGSLYKQGAGYRISPREASKIMLEESDNTALAVVANSIKGKLTDTESSINYLDLDLVVNPDGTISMDAKGYSSILKCVYFSCYNNKDDSQKILEQLSNSIFSSRIPAGIPDKSIRVAHKIGTNFNNNQNDCGIIYFPNNNYLLCVLIPGSDSAQTDKYIADISRIVYNYISSN